MNDTSGHAMLMMLHGQANEETGASPQPNPTVLAGLVQPENVERHRNVFCDHYDHCLDEALRQTWPSWSCERCPMFARDPVSQAMRVGHEAVNRPEAQF